jgi:2-haloacid dehalogenase
MQRLKAHFTLCTLSNGNLSLLTHMAKHAGLPWDLILSAEVFRHYKPDPQTYLGVADVFDVAPTQVMLVASHEDDLDAAAACGLQTAHVSRPLELGPGVTMQHGDLSRFTVAAQDFNDLADRLCLGLPTPLQP